MKLFGFTIGREKTSQVEEITVPSGDGKMSFSTPFLKIGKGNLGAPYVNVNYTISGIVQFGQDNLYPQILDQMYYTSPMHSGCIDFITNAAIGGGYEYKIPSKTGIEQVDIYTFEKKNKFKKLVRGLATDYLIHKRVCVIIKRDDSGNFKSMVRLNPATIRNNQEIQKFVYCKDWSRRTGLTEFNRYNPGTKEIESLYVYYKDTVGQDVYPLPSYISVLNDVFLDGEIAYLQKSNIQNSIWPSIVVRVPKMLESVEEREAFKDGLTSKSGAPGAGKIMVLQGQGFDNCPEVTTVSTNQNDKLFDSTLENIMNKICIAHGINPDIMGIKVTGSGGIGSGPDLQMPYSIFEKNVIIPLRMELKEIYDDLLDIAGIQNEIIINDFKIIDSEIVEDGKAGMKDEELSNDEIKTNATLTNLTGRQHQQMLRIIRQYGQEKLTKEAAAVLLKNSLGLSQEDIDILLTVE